MKDDDKQVGQVLSRREVLASMGAAGAALLAGSRSPFNSAAVTTALADLQVPGCVVRPAQEEGP